MTLHLTKQNPWPAAIIGFFIVALLGITVFITWAVRQNIDLVREDYYAEELRFQKQIDRANRAAHLARQASIVYDAKTRTVELSLPPLAAEATGYIEFYRPSNEKLDVTKKLALNAQGTQRIDVSTLEPGFWKARLFWKINGEEFFTEKSLTLQKGEF